MQLHGFPYTIVLTLVVLYAFARQLDCGSLGKAGTCYTFREQSTTGMLTEEGSFVLLMLNW